MEFIHIKSLKRFAQKFEQLKHVLWPAPGRLRGRFCTPMDAPSARHERMVTNIVERILLPHAQTRPETDVAGQYWFARGKPLEQCRRVMAARGDGILIACDVTKDSGAKNFGSVRDPSTLQEYLTRRRTMGLGHAHLYEGVIEDLPTKLYADIDLRTATRVEGDFERYKKHLDEVRDAFLVDVVGIPVKGIRFESSEAHGDAAGGGYKWSVHELLCRYYLKNFYARSKFKKAFEHFQKHLPARLQHCDEFLWHTPDPQRGPKLIWDPSVFAKFKCFRLLYSRKKGSDRPLLTLDGSSVRMADHLVGIYSEAELASLRKINVEVLERYNREVGVDAGERRKIPRRHTTRVAVEGGQVQGGTREDAEGAPLTAHELERLTSRYREDHPGAEIRATLQVATDVFTLHFRIQQPMCHILGAAHDSDGNNGGYLVYRRSDPTVAYYKCHSARCR
jgi:hypothetical protein